MIRKVSFNELTDYIKDLEYGKSIAIAENPDEESRWWSMTKINIYDSMALYVNYCGGGNAQVVEMTDLCNYPDDKEYFEDFKQDLSHLLEDTLSLDLSNTLIIDDESTSRSWEEFLWDTNRVDMPEELKKVGVLFKDDISQLAELYRTSNFLERNKIEIILDTMGHENELSDFHSGKLDKYLNNTKTENEIERD